MIPIATPLKVLPAAYRGMAAMWRTTARQRIDLRTNWNASWKVVDTKRPLSLNGGDQVNLDTIAANAGFLSQLELTTSLWVPYPDKENGHGSLSQRVTLFTSSSSHVPRPY